MTQTCPLRIPTYAIDAAPSVELYETNDALMESIFGAFFEQLFCAEGRLYTVPAMPRFSAMCRAVPAGLELSVMKTQDQSGRSLDLPVPVYSAMLAMRQDQSGDLCKAALVRAAEAGHNRVHPACAKALASHPAVPFVVVIPHSNVDQAESAGWITQKEVLLSLGLVNQFVGDVFDRFEVTPCCVRDGADEANVFFDLGERASEVEAPLGELIINPGADGYPIVHGFVADAGQQCICVEFPRDGSAVVRKARDRLALDAATLADLTALRLKAAAFWEDALVVIQASEEKLATLRRTSQMATLPDPLASLYTDPAVGHASRQITRPCPKVSSPRAWNWGEVPTLY